MGVRLPAEYQEVEYLESTGTQYIVLPISNITKTDEFELVVQRLNNTYTSCFGYSANGKYYDINLRQGSSPYPAEIAWGNTGTYARSTSELPTDRFHKIALRLNDSNKLVGSIDENQMSGSITPSAASLDAPLRLFGRSGANYYAITRCKSFRYWRDSAVSCDIISCYRKSDDKPGMYDLVSNTFFTNQGTGEFLVGPDIKYGLPYEYQEVEFIEGDGTQYIDTNIPLSTETGFFLDVIPKSEFQNTRYGNLIGAALYQSGWKDRFWLSTYSGGNISDGLSNSVYQVGLQKNVRSRVELKNGVYVSDLNPQRQINITILANNGTNVYLFYDGRDENVIAKMVLYSAMIYNGDSIVRDFVPCYRKADSKPGMYDLVTGTFFTNAGTGEFVVGAEVHRTISPRLMDRRRALIAKLTSLFRKVITSQTGLVSFDTNVAKPMKVTCEFSPKQSGTGDPSPDNVRPISGWTGCDIFQAQKNLFDKNAQPYITGRYISDGARVGDNVASATTGNVNYNIYALSVKPGQNYVFGIIRAAQPRMVAIDHDQKILAVYSNINSGGYLNCLTPDSTEYLLFSVAVAGTYKNIDDFQVEFGTIHSTYEAYHGADIPVTFTDPSTGDPRTVYGGTVTLNEDESADVVEKYRIYTLTRISVTDNSTSWDYSNTAGYRLKFLISTNGARFGTALCTHMLTTGDGRQVGTKIERTLMLVNNEDGGLRIYLYISGLNSKSATLDYIHAQDDLGTPITIAIPLSEAYWTTYHFDNIGQLQSFLGTNTVWSNLNGAITAEYYKKQQ